MRPKWNNLFWYERGDSGGKPQLENNTTKGFLKVLQECRPQVTKTLLEAILDKPLELEGATLNYETQITLDEITQADRTLHLLGLSHAGENAARQATPRTGSGRVDGLITLNHGETSDTIVIEVKTARDRLQEHQLGTYRGTLNIDSQYCYGLSWLTVWEIFETLRTTTTQEIDQLLLREFTEYLELMDMVPFRGFDREELQKPTSIDYKRSLMRGVNQQSPGAFAQALYEARTEYGFDDYTVVSNQDSTQLHLIEQRHQDAGRSTFDVNHYTVGFWNDQLNIQLNIRNRLLSTITKRASTEPTDQFVEILIDILEAAIEMTLTDQTNPLVYVRYHGNIPQEHDGQYQPSTFYLEQFTYGLDMTDRTGVQERTRLLARTVREATTADLVSSPAFVIEKQLPFTSSRINDERFPEYSLEFFETLRPMYELFEHT